VCRMCWSSVAPLFQTIFVPQSSTLLRLILEIFPAGRPPFFWHRNRKYLKKLEHNWSLGGSTVRFPLRRGNTQGRIFSVGRPKVSATWREIALPIQA